MTARIQHGEKGFSITFANGFVASIQYGRSNYCERRTYDIDKLMRQDQPREITSSDFELAVWKDGSSDRWVALSYHPDQLEDDYEPPKTDVYGWIPFGYLPKVLQLVQDACFDDLRKLLWSIRDDEERSVAGAEGSMDN